MIRRGRAPVFMLRPRPLPRVDPIRQRAGRSNIYDALRNALCIG
jgi:hypothetical protein